MLRKDKLHDIKFLIFKALINEDFNHDELVSVNNGLTLLRMGFFGAAHGRGGVFWPALPKIRYTYPPLMKLGTVIP